jgi:hypothetical protein
VLGFNPYITKKKRRGGSEEEWEGKREEKRE